MIGTSYGLLKSSQAGTNKYTINVGQLQVDFSGTTNTLSLNNAYPMSDEEGLLQNDVLDFTVINNGGIVASYNVYIDETSTNPSFKPVIRYVVNKNNTEYSEVKSISNNMLYIDKDQILNVNGTANYKVKMWIAEEADITYMNKVFTAKVVIESNQTTTINLNANGGTISSNTKVIAANSTTYGELPEPTREGYNFVGWYTALEGGTEVTSSTTFTYGTSPRTLYAHWEEDEEPWCPGPNCVYVGTLNGITQVSNKNNNYRVVPLGAPSQPDPPGPGGPGGCTVTSYTGTQGVNGTILQEGSYTTDYTSLNQSYFYAFILDNNRRIQRAFVCGIENNIPFCIEGTTDGSKYEKNIEILTETLDGCTDYTTDYHCSFDYSNFLDGYLSGQVHVTANGFIHFYVKSDGTLYEQSCSMGG